MRARTRPNISMNAPRHHRHHENVGNIRSASGAQGRVCLVSMRACEHICIVIIRFGLIFPCLIPPAQIARSYEYFRWSDFQFTISGSKSRFPIQADVACFRFRFPIPIRDFAISRFRGFFREFVIPQFRHSAISRFRDSAIPGFRDSAISRFRDFAIPEFPAFAVSPSVRKSVTSELSREYPRGSGFEAHQQRGAAFARSAPRQLPEPPVCAARGALWAAGASLRV